MSKYNINFDGDVLKVGFGDEPAPNTEIVLEAKAKAIAIKEQVMGKVLKINGPASLPVAMVLAHEFCHVVNAIAAFDPKLGGYVVAISHDPNFQVGDLIQ